MYCKVPNNDSETTILAFTSYDLQVEIRFVESNLTAPNMAAKVRSVVIAIVTRPGMDSETDSIKLRHQGRSIYKCALLP